MKRILLLSGLCLLMIQVYATEGMWIPSILGAVHDDMKAMGLELTAEDLYSVNHSSLKDAIVLFDGGCTAEIVSDQGLLFTNHHCGLDYIQFHSSIKSDYLKDGFWAKDQSGELICDGLSVMFIVRMDDVTESMRKGLSAAMTLAEQEAQIAANKKTLETDYKAKNPKLGLQIKAFNYGNQYFAIVTKTYNDVRLVGAPPSAVGKFGGDTDNWVWPRHTGDFSVFRIYADKDNEPAKYSADNVPFKPAHYLPVNLGGAHEGDYSMVYGFPGRTDHLLTSYAVDFVMNKSNPMRISMRDKTIAILDERMRSSNEIRIKYAAKQSVIANAWKKWQGQQIGLTNIRAVDQKLKFEEEYRKKSAIKGNEAYTGLLDELKMNYAASENYVISAQAYQEYVVFGPEVFGFAQKFTEVVENYDTLKTKGKLTEVIADLKKNARLFYKDFDLETEKRIYADLTPMFHANFKGTTIDRLPAGKTTNWKLRADELYKKSIFRDSTVLFKLLDNFSKGAVKKFKKDYFYHESSSIGKSFQTEIRPKSLEYQKQIDFLMQRYTEGMMKMFPGDYWADANSTLRVTFGKIDGSDPRDGEHYKYFTTADGILEKYYTKNPDFELNSRLIELFEKRQYGNYAEDGELRVCYTGSNHTTGGNSGSPALNSKGHLVGINFDRSWESTMSDIVYNPEICRNIMVDVRYVLWVIDVYAGAGYLLDEMKIVR
ncbi:MAG: S46 family peptidase [Flavobacteriales bacterium]